MTNDLGTFVGVINPHFVQKRSKWKIANTYAPSFEDHPQPQLDYVNGPWCQEFSELELMYQEFCEKAHKLLRSSGPFNGEGHSRRPVFPDFYYDVIEEKFPVK